MKEITKKSFKSMYAKDKKRMIRNMKKEKKNQKNLAVYE